MNLKSCPDCGGALGRNADKCRCGWQVKTAMPRLIAECCGCKLPATHSLITPMGRQNFCNACADEYHHSRAVLNNKDRGIETVEQYKAFCRKTLAGLR
jgi:hypothetical protein